MFAPKRGGIRIAMLIAAPLIVVPLSSAFACDMSQSMTDASCANMGFPNVFNNPPPPPPMDNSADYYGGQPHYALGILGLFEGPHPTMIYPRSPIICRQGLNCPGDVPAPQPVVAEPSYPPAPLRHAAPSHHAARRHHPSATAAR